MKSVGIYYAMTPSIISMQIRKIGGSFTDPTIRLRFY